ncbi:CBM96 family carbohydrate-binding protein [Paenibacillus roseipurpureus]|uniref:DNRLRE domain-containing protein n=1 Tax=Paenibacillus roseopurpureus TaxID=2918901 RepID=A0AA96RK19_9BACL|nr:DNRLRE domain-containing protein [Paenibacillus sp. MBLB1832]WNR45978.1 DNRLRE domain-containing protein [Paenibacillus sp. MBLB1832]
MSTLGIFTVQADTALAANTSYYVDSVNGLDNNDGMSISTAWKTLGRVNAGPNNTGDAFQPGDRILFKRNGIWSGQLAPKGSGSSGSPIVIDMYGDSGNKPILNGDGIIGATVSLFNQEYMEIRNLEVTNDATSPAIRYGIRVVADNFGIADHIYIVDCTVRNVKGQAGTAGIHFFVPVNTVATKFNDILVERNVIKTTDKNGIYVESKYRDVNLATNVVIRNNYLEDVGGDSILPIGASNALIEYNVVNGGSARAFGPTIALWPFASDDSLFQYNEVFNNNKLIGNNDGQALDGDYKSRRTLFQYNYTHDNKGGFIGIFNDGSSSINYNIDPVFRYNISQNDGEISGISITFSGPSTGAQLYNNTVYSNRSLKVMVDGDYAGTATNVKFTNNLFYNTGNWSQFGDGDFTYRNNSVFNGNGSSSYPNDPNLITTDPKLVNPGSGGTWINFDDPNKLAGYKLQSSSPLINNGVAVTANGGKDFWGQPLYSGNPDIGAFEYYPQTSGTPANLSFVAIDDSSVRDGTSADTNQAGSTSLTVLTKKDAIGWNREGFLKFDFNNFTGTVKEAFITLYPTRTDSIGIQNTVALISDNNWTESGITWNSRPASGTILGTYTITSGTPLTIDVTSQVQAAMSTGKVVSIRVYPATATASGPASQVEYASSESLNKIQRPVLKINASYLPVADAFVRDDQSGQGTYGNTNYGSADKLETKLDLPGWDRESYMKFDLSNVNLSQVSYAKVRLYAVETGTSAIQTDAYYVSSDSWQENGITWNNKPSSTTSAIATWTKPAAGTWVEFDVTTQLNNELANSSDKQLSLRLVSKTSGSESWIRYATKEYATAAYRPELIVKP